MATLTLTAEDLETIDALEAESCLSPQILAKHRSATTPTYFSTDEAPPAWELPESMLTGGMPSQFEATRRDVGDLSEALQGKQKEIEGLLARMAKLRGKRAAG